MNKNINSVSEFKQLLVDEGVFNSYLLRAKENPTASLMALQETIDHTKLLILCNDLSLYYKPCISKTSSALRIDDLYFCSPAYAVFSFIMNLPPDYLETHKYLFYNDSDMHLQIEDIRNEEK